MRIGTIRVKQFTVAFRRYPLQIRPESVFVGGFHVVAQIMDCGDGMFQEIQHPAVFKSLAEADVFMEKVSRNRMSWNLKNWRIGDHPCDAYQRKPEDNPLFFGVHNPVPAF